MGVLDTEAPKPRDRPAVATERQDMTPGSFSLAKLSQRCTLALFIFPLLCFLLASCETRPPPTAAPLNDIIQHYFSIRAEVERKPFNVELVKTDTMHIEKSAKSLEEIYQAMDKKKTAKRLRADAQFLHLALSGGTKSEILAILQRIEKSLKDLKAL